jgi:hypothetical protein
VSALAALYHALNVGVIDVDKLHRIDLERMRLAAEDQTNFMCDAVGKMFLRPGTGYVTTTAGDGAKANIIPFIASSSSAYLLELSASALRIIDCSTDLPITRPSVDTTVTSGDMSASTGWTLATTSGQTSTIVSNQLQLSARAHGGKAIAYNAVAVVAADQGVEHALRIVVDRGPVTLRVGSTVGGAEYVSETTLKTGTHSIAYIPTDTFYVQFSTSTPQLKIVSECQIEAAGAISLPTSYTATEVFILQVAQSLDVMFVACYGKKPMRIERRGNGASAGRSWSIVDYGHDDGPFNVGRSADIKLTPSGTQGNITITASEPFFTSAMVGELLRIYHDGQRVNTFLAALAEHTETIEVTGVNETDYNERDWTWTIAGTWVGTLRVQRSFDGNDSGFHDFRKITGSAVIDITANAASQTNDENDDNAITWYRFNFAAYTSGEAQIDMSYDGGGGTGIVRITDVASNVSASAEVLDPLQGIIASDDWQEGRWGGNVGYPTGVAFHEGRLTWIGNDQFDGSVSDAYESFDDSITGDAGPLSRTIALGGRNEGRWLLSLSSLFAGTDSLIASINASTLDEILTPTNFAVRQVASVGSEIFQPVKLSDDRGLYIGAGGTSLYELSYDTTLAGFVATQFSKLTANLYTGGVTGMKLQKLPDQRIWISVANSPAACVVYEPREKVIATIPIETAGDDIIEAFAVIPSADGQDRVYMSVKRIIGGNPVRYIEKLAMDSEAKPGTVSKVMDAFVSGTGAHSATITGLDHLEGRTVVAWVDGAPVCDDAADNPATTFTVTGGEITLPVAPTAGYCVGLAYRARFKSSRLGYAPEDSTAMLRNKEITRAGFLFADYVRSGVQFGTEFDNPDHPLDRLPALAENGAAADEIVIGVAEDESPHPIGGGVGLDTRLCVEANSPKPVTVLSIVLAEDMGVG